MKAAPTRPLYYTSLGWAGKEKSGLRLCQDVGFFPGFHDECKHLRIRILGGREDDRSMRFLDRAESIGGSYPGGRGEDLTSRSGAGGVARRARLRGHVGRRVHAHASVVRV